MRKEKTKGGPKQLSAKEEQKAFAQALKDENPWEAAKAISVVRDDYFQPLRLDPGVNFFVLALNALGVKTKFSCEGHPNGFYITFYAPERTAREISAARFFHVEIENEPNYWSLRLCEQGTKAAQKKTLSWAAQAWKKAFFNHDKKS